MALSHSGIPDASLNDYELEEMAIYACENDLCCDLVLRYMKDSPPMNLLNQGSTVPNKD